MPFHVVLVRPDIPANTGNIIRLCSNTGCRLHLVRPLGFAMDDKRLRRAGLDYHEYADVQVHDHWQSVLDASSNAPRFTLTTRGTRHHSNARLPMGSWLVFGSETTGLPAEIMGTFAQSARLRIPMQQTSRSLNLSNAVAITVYEAWRQNDYCQQETPP